LRNNPCSFLPDHEKRPRLRAFFMVSPASWLERKPDDADCRLSGRRIGVFRLARIFRDMTAGHALYPFASLFTTKTHLVFRIAMWATGAGNELFAYHFFLQIFCRKGLATMQAGKSENMSRHPAFPSRLLVFHQQEHRG
jgi:hypothetical protein